MRRLRIAFGLGGKHDTIAALNALNAKNCPTRVFALTVISDGAVAFAKVSLMRRALRLPRLWSCALFMGFGGADKLQSKPTDHFFASYFREYLKIMEAYMDIILQYKILCSANLKLLVDTSTAIVKVTGVSQQKLSPRIKRNVLTQGERAEHATPVLETEAHYATNIMGALCANMKCVPTWKVLETEAHYATNIMGAFF
ncbi:hypothetical protein Tco_1518150 [Tanacetum coccineum]